MRRLKALGGDKGTVAVEFALVFPILMLLIFAVVEVGAAWYSKQMLVNASRDGARMASLLNSEEIDDQMVEDHVNLLLTNQGFPGEFVVDCQNAEGAPGDLVTVNVTSEYEMPILGNLVPDFLSTVTLSATTVMRHE